MEYARARKSFLRIKNWFLNIGGKQAGRYGADSGPYYKSRRNEGFSESRHYVRSTNLSKLYQQIGD